MNKNKVNKSSKGGTDRNAGGGTTQSSKTSVKEIHNERDKPAPAHKIAPTAEQLRIAQMIDNTHSEKQLQEKINQITQVTGVSTDDAVIALHDCNHDVSCAIDALLEGENQGEWKESTKKKKKTGNKGKDGKDDNESNKENRRNDTRERGSSRTRGSAPRSRGRGGRGSGPREEASDGFERGSNRKGRMTNGSAGSYRGRGTRGRGSNHRTFQTKEPLGFTETIDTWGETPIEKTDDLNSLQIDTWGEEPVPTHDEWGDNEWTGSLAHTTIFGPTTSSSSPNASSSLNKSDSSPKGGTGAAAENASNPVLADDEFMANGTHPDPINLLMRQRSPATKLTPVKGGNNFGTASEAIGGLADLLQKAPTHPMERISTAAGSIDNSTLTRSNLSPNPQSNLLSNLTGSAGTTVPQMPTASKQYSAFSSSNVRSQNLASINEEAISKALGLVSQQANITSRTAKQASRKIPPSVSKIPLSAVEMPEDAMAALDMQMTGLEFGAEAPFDFTSSDAQQQPPAAPSNNMVSASGPGISSAMQQSQPQPNLGPEPIPLPAQGPERKTGGPSGPAGLTNQRSAPQSFGELKKDNCISGLVPTPPTYQSYPPTTSFPSPPSTHFAQSQSQTYSGSSAGTAAANSYPGQANNSKANNSSVNNPTGGTSFSANFPSHTSVTSPYQTNYASSSSHSNLSSINVPGLKEQSQQIQNYNEPSATTLSGSLSSTNASSVATNSEPNTLASLSASANSGGQSKPPASGKPTSVGNSVPPGVPHLLNHSQQQIMHHALGQVPHHQLPQQTQMVTGHGPSQYVNPQTAALQGTIPPAFYNVQQPAMYSYEDLQMFQRGIPHLAPTSLPGARDGSITSPASYSASETGKFRTDQNSSPVPSTISQQAATAGGTYITAAGNAAMPPFYMYHNMAAIPNSFPQYGHPAIIQLPPNTHTGSTTTQFPGPPKLPYAGTSNYYETMSQSQEYKSGYGSASQGQSKSGSNSSGTANNPGSDLTGYKNHFSKVGRSYEKPGYHSGTPPPFNLTGSGSNPMTANAYGPAMFFSTVPAAQHHSPLMHHQLHQEATSGTNQRGGLGGSQNKAASKSGYSGSYWGSN